MSESYPYFSIAKKYGVPYGDVLDWAASYERMLIWNISKPEFQSDIRMAIYLAVIAENTRREKVIQQNRPLINNLTTSESS